MKVNIIIPARYGSTRLPGKPLQKIMGKEMIRWVVERIKPDKSDYRVYVATDDERIRDALRPYGYCRVLLSGREFQNGSERVYWASGKAEKADITINLQGDEPLINFETIEMLAKATRESESGFATLYADITEPADIDNPNAVKLVLSNDGYAVYFSRLPIPYNRDRMPGIIYKKHIGIYGFTCRALELFNNWGECGLEKAERLEQLRILANGRRIRAVKTDKKLISVDTQADIEKVEDYLSSI